MLCTTCKFQQGSAFWTDSDTLIGKTVTFPSSLLRLEAAQFFMADSFIHEIEGKTKVISIIDGTCMSCIIGQFNSIDSIFHSILPQEGSCRMVFILNVKSSDSSFFMRNLYPAINANGVILWDNCYSFERSNKLLTPNPFLRTFLVGKDSRIKLYGNPTMNPSIISEYKEIINNIQ